MDIMDIITEEVKWVNDYLFSLKIKKLNHPKYVKSFRKLMALSLACREGEIILIIGPTRAGKTTLLKDYIEQQNRGALNKLYGIYIAAQNNSKNSEFDPKEFSEEIMEIIEHPFLSTFGYGGEVTKEFYKETDRVGQKIKWKAFEKYIDHKNIKEVILDEIHHVGYMQGGPGSSVRFFDSWKARLNKSECKYIYGGGYPALDILGLSPHSLGREFTIHFSRYYQNEEDVKGFLGILDRYSRGLKFKGNKNLRHWFDHLYEYSLGTIGLLDKLIRAALVEMIIKGDSKLDYSHIRNGSMYDEDRNSIKEEIDEGEQYLGIDKNGERKARVVINNPSNNTTKQNQKKKKGRGKKKVKPFQKNPRRYVEEKIA